MCDVKLLWHEPHWQQVRSDWSNHHVRQVNFTIDTSLVDLDLELFEWCFFWWNLQVIAASQEKLVDLILTEDWNLMLHEITKVSVRLFMLLLLQLFCLHQSIKLFFMIKLGRRGLWRLSLWLLVDIMVRALGDTLYVRRPGEPAILLRRLLFLINVISCLALAPLDVIEIRWCSEKILIFCHFIIANAVLTILHLAVSSAMTMHFELQNAAKLLIS